MSALTSFLKLGLTHVSHDEMVEFAEGYPWTLEWRFNNGNQPSWAAWEPPRHGREARLIVIKKFTHGYKDFNESKGECFVCGDPDYLDDRGLEWRKIEGRLFCVIAAVGIQTRNGKTFTANELAAVAGSERRCNFTQFHNKLLFDMSLRSGFPPHLKRTQKGVTLHGV